MSRVALAESGSIEARLQRIYCRVLALPSVTSSDNILDLGGHSIPIMMIVGAIRQELGIEVSIKDVFRAPTIAQLASVLESRATSRPPAKEVLNGSAASALTIAAATGDQKRVDHWRTLYPGLKELYPVTGMQLGLLFHSMSPGSRSAYTNQIYLTIRGAFHPAALKKAWSMVIDRHPILRTAIVALDLEEPLQLVVDAVALPWRELDHRELTDADRDTAFEECRQGEKDLPFDFGRPPLMRLLLIQERESWRFIWTYHHLLLDGWSEALVWDEVLKIYSTLCEGGQVSLPVPALYSDYVGWLRRQNKQSQRDYWRQQLRGIGRATRLGIEQDGCEPDGQGRAEVRHRLTHQQSEQLRGAARSSGVTLFTLVQAAWACVLHRHSGDSEVVCGVTTSGRAIDLARVESIVGLLINTIPSRIAFEPEQPVGSWLQRIHDSQVEQEANSHLTLVEIQSCSEVRPGTALFDSVVLFASYPVTAPGLATSLDISEYQNDEQTHFGITVIVVPGDDLAVTLGFNPSRFRRSDVTKLLGEFCRTLAALATRPASSSLRELLARSTDTAEDSTGAPTRTVSRACRQGERQLGRYLVHQLIENQVLRSPEKLALRCNEKTYTYDSLNRAANRTANFLLASCPLLKAEAVIAVMLPRGDDLLLTILGIWKAGAAYLPIDPALPDARIRVMLQTSGAVLLVTSRECLRRHPHEGLDVTTVTLEASTAEMSEENPDVNVSGNDLSYIIYTSGSTGTPKGAMVEHIGMLNNIANKITDLEITERSCVAQTASQSFDISVWQMFIALTRGGTTVIYDERVVNDIALFITRLRSDAVTVVEMVPSYLVLVIEYLLANAGSGLPEGLQFLVLTGESADAAFIMQWFRYFPATRVMNAYGPTEASDDITHHVIFPGDEVVNPVPIGRVLANFDIYVVDEHLRPVPLGEKGEIVVTGVGVGRGYVGLPGPTNKSFVPSPFPDRYRGRLYKTGDVGEMRPDGLLLFHGRKDQQVKVHGFRIELEEVERKLLEMPAVRQAVVLDVRPPQGEAFLCAFIVPHGTLDNDDLSRQLKQQLPTYMVPREVRCLPSLPRLDNGKIDRNTLRTQYSPVSAGQKDYEPPTSEIQLRLARIWEQVLNVQRIGIHDDFFDLGGDSFRAIRIAAKYGPALEVTDVYNLRTIAAVAARLEESGRAAARRVVCIYGGESARVTVLGIPNSGGDPVSFVALGEHLAKLGTEVSLYAVRLPRRAIDGEGGMRAEIERLTEEICAAVAEDSSGPLVVFGQCNGSALAISVARRLQGRVSLRALCIGGALLRTRETPRDARSDRQIMQFLSSLEATVPSQPDEMAFFLGDFRYDSELADTYYNSLLVEMGAGASIAIDAPIHCIVGSEDPVVAGYRDRWTDWRRLSRDAALIQFPGRGHFLLRDCPRELARTLRDIALGKEG